MDADNDNYDNDNSSTDSFIELINMQTSIIITKDKQDDSLFSKIKDCIEPIYRHVNYYINIFNKSKVD